MKILFDHTSPFLFAHGGFQKQIEQTRSALASSGVEVEYLRWWDDAQKADLIHYFGRPVPGYIASGQRKGIKIVIAPLLSGLGARSSRLRFVQKLVITLGRSVLPKMLTGPFGWDSFLVADGCIALTAWEAHLMSHMFKAPPEKVHVVPNGVEEVFFQSRLETRNQWLVCTSTITDVKRVLELAEAAVHARTPLWIVGKAYADTDPYAQRFFALARNHPEVIRFEGPIFDRQKLAQVYRQSRGFALLSAWESLSLSALEAAACECPLLLSDLPWARTVFKEDATYCPVMSPTRTAEVLRRFYDAAPTLKPPPKPMSWRDVALKLKGIYEGLLSTSR